MTNSIVDSSAKIGRNVNIGHFAVIEANVVIGDNVTVGNNVTIHEGTTIGDNCYIESNAVLGRKPRPAKTSTVKFTSTLPALKLGEGTTVGVGAVLYAGSIFGSDVMVGDLASVREKCNISNNVVIGRGVAIENQVEIGEFTKIQTNAYITAYTTLEDYVFIAPMVTTTNDNYMGRGEERFKYIKGPTVKKGSRVGGASVLCPGITIAAETFVAAGAVVTKDTAEGSKVKGVPAKG
ncbi:MAG: N-acetyltransferase [Clostridia bacterium]|jgi:UDP-3-O-[3-hydroxymyristoyl] glucosamine N-acyltransferase|nr:N-acetyltransferase [Clostridia bacterium]